jgi:hypothetical protein
MYIMLIMLIVYIIMFICTSGSSTGSSKTFSGGTAQDGSLSAQAGPRRRDGPAGPHLRANDQMKNITEIH